MRALTDFERACLAPEYVLDEDGSTTRALVARGLLRRAELPPDAAYTYYDPTALAALALRLDSAARSVGVLK